MAEPKEPIPAQLEPERQLTRIPKSMEKPIRSVLPKDASQAQLVRFSLTAQTRESMRLVRENTAVSLLCALNNVHTHMGIYTRNRRYGILILTLSVLGAQLQSDRICNRTSLLSGFSTAQRNNLATPNAGTRSISLTRGARRCAGGATALTLRMRQARWIISDSFRHSKRAPAPVLAFLRAEIHSDLGGCSGERRQVALNLQPTPTLRFNEYQFRPHVTEDFFGRISDAGAVGWPCRARPGATTCSIWSLPQVGRH